MAIVSKQQFAKLAGVGPSAISSAIADGLVIPAGPGRRDGIDTTLDRNAAYLRFPDHQRHDGAWRRKLKAARAERDARAKLAEIEAMPAGYDRVAGLTDLFWERGAFPAGWAILGLRDVRADNGLPVPLVFYSPNGEEGDLGVGAIDDGRFQIIDDGKGPVVARDKKGIDHPLVLRVFGKVAWLEDILAPEKGKSAKATSELGRKSGSKIKKSKSAVGVRSARRGSR